MSTAQLLATPEERGTRARAGGLWRRIDLPERGTTYAYDRPGLTPLGPTVVFLHGWTATGSLNWTPTLATLDARYRVVALDHRGHGRGIRGPAEFTLEDCADDAVALLDVLGVRTAIFVGYSMGGPIAQLIWRRHRRRVSGLVLCATAADFTMTADQEQLVRAVDQLQRASGVIPRSLRLHAVRPFVTGLVTDRGTRTELLEAIGSHDQHAIREAGQAIRRFRSTEWIGAIDVPVVVVVTERDLLVRPDRQRQLATSIPGARTITVDAGHLAAFSQPDVIAQAVAVGCDEIAARHTRTARFARSMRRLLRRRHRSR